MKVKTTRSEGLSIEMVNVFSSMLEQEITVNKIVLESIYKLNKTTKKICVLCGSWDTFLMSLTSLSDVFYHVFHVNNL